MCTMRQILGGMVHSNYQWPVENMLHALKVPTSAVAIVLFPFYVVMVAMNKGLHYAKFFYWGVPTKKVEKNMV